MWRIWLIPVAILGFMYMYKSLVLLKASGTDIFLYAAIRFRYLYKKTYCNRICRFIPLKAVNAKETFHAHQVSTRALRISSKGIASKVQNSRSTKPSCVELCKY